MAIVLIKFVHTLIFVVLSAAVVYLLYCGMTGVLTVWTGVALGLVVIESAVLVLTGWRCPLTVLVERLGAKHGSVSDIFLPKWCADRIFPVCGSLFGLALALLAWQWVRR